MRTQIASRLARLEHNAGTGSRRIVVVERKSLEAARAFLQGLAPSTAFMAFCDPKFPRRCTVRSQIICDELVWDKALFNRLQIWSNRKSLSAFWYIP